MPLVIHEESVISNRKFLCLVVNDCPIQLGALSYIMRKLDFEVHQASNGYQALQKVRAIDYNRVSPKSIYSCILMDLNMPIVDGYQVRPALRSESSSK